MEFNQKEWQDKIRQNYGHAEALSQFMINTLESFAHRYLNSPNISMGQSAMLLEGYELNMGEALKTQNPKIKEAVKQLAKSVPREAQPRLVSRIIVEIHQLTADQGKLTLTAQVNWNHPDYAISSENKLQKVKVLVWNDLTEFRKGFPLGLEEVCELFL